MVIFGYFENENDTVGDLELRLVDNASFETTIPA